MGMECRLRRISEFELAAYRKDPAKLYSDLFPSSPTALADFGNVTSLMEEVQNSPLSLRIRERALAGETLLEQDVQAFQREMQDVLKDFPQFAKAMEKHQPGISQDQKSLSLHKSWSCLNFLFIGNGMEPDDSVLGKSILGGAEIPDANGVMGYGPVRYLLPAGVREIYAALAEFPIETTAREFDAEKADLARVYVPHHGPEELVQYFNWLLEFYRGAAEKGEAVLLWIS